jgi:hypothetical protein
VLKARLPVHAAACCTGSTLKQLLLGTNAAACVCAKGAMLMPVLLLARALPAELQGLFKSCAATCASSSSSRRP